MDTLANFLEIDSGFYSGYSFERINETYGVKNRKLHLWAMRVKQFVPSWLQQSSQSIYMGFNRTEIPPISGDEKTLLLELEKAYAQELPENLLKPMLRP